MLIPDIYIYAARVFENLGPRSQPLTSDVLGADLVGVCWVCLVGAWCLGLLAPDLVARVLVPVMRCGRADGEA
jgi:hypothetical protein